jgi:predicted acetyltransferase
MAVEVRPIAAEELVDWVEVQHIAFHVDRPPTQEADYRRDVRGQDLARSLAAVEDGRILGTYESFPTELTLPGGTCVTANAVSSVSVLPTHHRRGLLRRMIEYDLRLARERGEVASILVPSEYPIYGRFGFGRATDRAEYCLDVRIARFLRTAPGSVELVQPAELCTQAPALFERFRKGYPGQIDRSRTSWEVRLGLRESPWRSRDEAPRVAAYTSPSGEIEGYLLYRVHGDWHSHTPTGRLEVQELVAVSPEAYLGLWRYCAEMDLIASVEADMRSLDEPLAWQLDNARAALQQTARTDFLWLRPMDVPRFLAARRYTCEQRLVLEVSDPLGMANGRYIVESGPDGGTSRESQESPDLTLSMAALGAISLGGVSLRLLQDAGLVDEHSPNAIETGERLFRWPVTPWCSTFF